MGLKIRHWVAMNGSGMNHVARSCAEAERRLGHDAEVVDCQAGGDAWEQAADADVHVSHTHFPDGMRERCTKPCKVVFVAHGTPEHVMDMTIEAFAHPGYGPADGWMLLRHLVKTADAVVTFWDRHRWIYQSLVPKERTIHAVPLGVDKEFWTQGVDQGHYAGSPAVWTSENQHRIKWALDLLIAWPDVVKEVPGARLHAHYIPTNLHRFFMDLANSNGAAYYSYLSGGTYTHEVLRSMWRSFDFFLSPVRYGDHNNLFMQAATTGLKTISYAGNVYADYWIPEGDQRAMVKQLAAIFRGEVEPRSDKQDVPDIMEMGKAMVSIYEQVVS